MEKVVALLKEVAPHLVGEVLEGDRLEAAEALAAASVVHWSSVAPVRRALTLVGAHLLNGGEPPDVEEALAWVRDRKKTAVREYAEALRALAKGRPSLAPHLLRLAEALEEGRATREMALEAAKAVEDHYASTTPRSESEAVRRGMEMGALRAAVLNAVGPLVNLEIGLGVARRLLGR
ncbi:hypothetical protein MN1_160 [Thermus phage MN1]|nr:hypothetical protein MN1_160 [Thermus phage MN1]